MENLFLPDVDLSEVPEFNFKYTVGHWYLKSVNLELYRCFLDVFTENECLEILKIGKSFNMNQSRTFGGTGFDDVRKSENSWLPVCELTSWIYEKIEKVLIEANNFYQYDLYSIENLQFTKYNKNYKGFYKAHIDQGSQQTQVNHNRKLSFSINLSKEENYQGGNLNLYATGLEPIVAIKQIGSINFFPSFVVHEVTPVIEGTRYTLVGWVSGPKFK